MATKEKKDEGAQFVRYFGPLLDVLRGLGGSAKADEAVDRVANDLNVPDEVLNETLPSGGSRFAIKLHGLVSTSFGKASSTLPNTVFGASPKRDLRPFLRPRNLGNSSRSGSGSFRNNGS